MPCLTNREKGLTLTAQLVYMNPSKLQLWINRLRVGRAKLFCWCGGGCLEGFLKEMIKA